MSQHPPPVICWLRRDLRLDDNLALGAALATRQPVIVLFILEPAILDSPRAGEPRYQFMLAALRALDDALRAYDRRLLVRRGDSLAVLREVIAETGADRLFFNQDYTPFARRRDAIIRESAGVPVEVFHDRLLVAPEQIATGDGRPYTVYTPFKNKWRTLPKMVDHPQTYTLNADRLYDISALRHDDIPALAASAVPLPEATPKAALTRLANFTAQTVYAYADARNRLADPFDDPRNGTSSLSPYVRFGLLSLRQMRAAAADAYKAAPGDTARESVNTWMDEVIWHEFYTHVLWHFPHAASGNFNRKYDAVQWRHAPDELAAWEQGQTGYPIVDAAMRQLRATGWMHNRARMIVASFLTKDLLIDWRAGELHFMRWLLDGDTAANNGGWQWAAGTGTDAQPYFRIFNPVAQSKKFDPDGRFIRRWLPELKDVPDKFIHEPWRMSQPPRAYPAPMVEHGMARERTLRAFEVIKQKEGN